MNNWTPILFFSLVVLGAAFIDMILAGTGLTDFTITQNQSYNNITGLTLADVQLGEDNPIGSKFGGNILMKPFAFVAWINSLTLNYSWLNGGGISVIRYIWLSVVGAYAIFASIKAAASILQFLPFRR